MSAITATAQTTAPTKFNHKNQQKQARQEQGYNGEPGCRTLQEVNQVFRNFWDPTSYWKCEAVGQSAKKVRCPQSNLYSDSKGKCIHYTEWQWTEPTEPPSRPDRYSN